MAGDWIPMRLDLYEDPAVLEMAERMEVRPEVVVGYCHKIWSWVSRQCHAESVTGVTLKSLGTATNLHGFPELMVEVGWLATETDGSGRPVLIIPHFDRWLSNTAKTRVSAASRKRKQRQSDGENVTEMSRSERDKSVTKGKERTEEDTKDADTFTKGSNLKGKAESGGKPPTPPVDRQTISFDPSTSDGLSQALDAYPKRTTRAAATDAWDRTLIHLHNENGLSGYQATEWMVDRIKCFASRGYDPKMIPKLANWLDDEIWSLTAEDWDTSYGEVRRNGKRSNPEVPF